MNWMQIKQIPQWLGLWVSLTLVCWAGIGPSTAWAQAPTFHIKVDTRNLSGLGLFYLEFQSFDGNTTTGDGNSQAVVSNFTLTGGALGAALPPIGNATGSLAGTLTLQDGPAAFGPLADFTQAFEVTSATSRLNFDLQLSATDLDSPLPDSFN